MIGCYCYFFTTLRVFVFKPKWFNKFVRTLLEENFSYKVLWTKCKQMPFGLSQHRGCSPRRPQPTETHFEVIGCIWRMFAWPLIKFNITSPINAKSFKYSGTCIQQAFSQEVQLPKIQCTVSSISTMHIISTLFNVAVAI